MRLTAPELAARYRDGIIAEGAHVLDAGQVGTEMLYFLVGSRELDGGLMCTASHNPKAYTGAKLVKRGAIALSGDEGIGDIRDLDARPTAASPRPADGAVEDVDVSAEFQAAALAFIDPANVKPLKVVVDGGNGMAGPMVGPLLERLGLDLVDDLLDAGRQFPDHEPNPLLPENRRFIIDKVRAEGADLGIAWDGDADRCFFIDDTRRLRRRRLPDRDPGRAPAGQARRGARRSSTTCAPPRGRRHRRAPPAARRSINRVGHAFFKTRMRDEGAIFGGEVSGHYYFHDFYNADTGTIPALLILEKLSVEGEKLCELLEPYRSKYFISGEINSEVDDAHGQDGRDRGALRPSRAADVSHVDGV